MKQVINFVKKETVLTAAWVLAIISMIWVHPSGAYLGYIDFRSLGILWSLMVVMAGWKGLGLFDRAGGWLLQHTGRTWQLCGVLVFLCFFASMFITNDVSLITFVPFAIFTLEECGRKDLFIPVITLQTLAANLGSMLTPIGNPQNLYLYGISGMSMMAFLKLMIPYTGLSFVLLLLSLCFIKRKKERVTYQIQSKSLKSRPKTVVHGLLFVVALFVVARVVPYWILVIVVFAVVLVMDRKSLISIDYALLFTFVGFFIFTGNLQQIPVFNSFLQQMVEGREVFAGVLASQVISNVPAALLLSSFTDRLDQLIIGVNLGGLGTLIASMASLISFKSLAHAHNELKGRYLAYFTGMNVLFLAVLLVPVVIF